jgi:16S rRNA (uracil1498-N3)-methyltransferase
VARFHAPAAERVGDLVELPRDEAAHLTRVLRLGVGAAVRVFNGRGAEFEGVVEQLSKTGVRVRVETARPPQPEMAVRVTLAQAAIKGDGMDDVVRDAVMMGVSVVQPMVTERSEVSLASLARGRRRERWQRIAVSSAKQCGRAVVPAVAEPRTVVQVLEELRGTPGEAVLLCVEPSAAVDAVSVSELETPPSSTVTLLVGPEGGWAPEELTLAAPICRFVTIGGRTLRANAAAVVALSAVFARWRLL